MFLKRIQDSKVPTSSYPAPLRRDLTDHLDRDPPDAAWARPAGGEWRGKPRGNHRRLRMVFGVGVENHFWKCQMKVGTFIVGHWLPDVLDFIPRFLLSWQALILIISVDHKVYRRWCATHSTAVRILNIICGWYPVVNEHGNRKWTFWRWISTLKNSVSSPKNHQPGQGVFPKSGVANHPPLTWRVNPLSK